METDCLGLYWWELRRHFLILFCINVLLAQEQRLQYLAGCKSSTMIQMCNAVTALLKELWAKLINDKYKISTGVKVLFYTVVTPGQGTAEKHWRFTISANGQFVQRTHCCPADLKLDEASTASCVCDCTYLHSSQCGKMQSIGCVG